MHTHDQAHPFRDGTAGAEAKRRKLLTDRRDDLATMNHEIRRVYVTRLAKLCAALALGLGGGLLVLASYHSGLGELISTYMPGSAPAPLSTLLLGTWVLAALALLGGRAFAEHRFNLAMTRAVLPTSELHSDVARLSHEAPDSVGRHMARRLEVPSRMGSVLATGLIIPASALAALLLVDAGGYPAVDQVENLLSDQASALASIALMALVTSLCIALRPNLRSVTILTLAVAGGEALAVGTPSILIYLLPVALLLAAVHMRKTRLHRRQNASIEQEGAPLPPVFAPRKHLRSAWARLATLPSQIRHANIRQAMRHMGGRLRAILAQRPSAPQILSAAVLIAGAAAITLAIWPGDNARASASQSATVHSGGGDPDLLPPLVAESQAIRIDDGNDGALIDMHFQGKQPIEASDLLGGVAIPSGWRATITIHRISGAGSFFVQALPEDAYGSAPRQLTAENATVTFERTNCTSTPMPLPLNVSAYGDWADSGHAQLRYEVRMDMIGTCL